MFHSPDRRTSILDSVNATVHAWHDLVKRQGCTILYSPHTPLEWCDWLPVVWEQEESKALKTIGVTKVGDLFSDGSVRTWDETGAETQNVTPLVRFHFYRVHHTFQELLGEDMAEPPEVIPFSLLLKADSPSGLVSNIYSTVQDYRNFFNTKSRLEWQTDLGIIIDDDTWKCCCEATQEISLNGRHRLIHFMFLHKVYYTPARLHRYGLCESAECDRYRASPADFIHTAWLCPSITDFWKLIFQKLSDTVETPLTPDPSIALLGYSKKVKKGIRRLVEMGL